MTEIKHGKHGRPRETELDVKVPPEIHMLAIRLADSLDDDWSMTGGWLVMRQWHTPNEFSIVIAHVVEETQMYEALEAKP